MDDKLLRSNAASVALFISIADKIFGAGGPGTYEMPPLERKSRGTSRPALTPAAMKYIENTENRRTAKVVTPFIEALREVPRNYYLGYDLYTLVCLCGWNTHDHGYLRNLKAPEDDEGRRELAAWDFVTMLLATKATKQLESQGRNPKLNVVVAPRDEIVGNKTEARDKDRRVTRDESYKRRYESYRRLEIEMGVDVGEASREAAKARFSELWDISVPTIERFIRFSEKEGVA